MDSPRRCLGRRDGIWRPLVASLAIPQYHIFPWVFPRGVCSLFGERRTDSSTACGLKESFRGESRSQYDDSTISCCPQSFRSTKPGKNSSVNRHAVALLPAIWPWYNGGVFSQERGPNMQKTKCPTCGSETAPNAGCPNCGHAASNGVAIRHEPTPPPELAGLVIERSTPEMLEEARRTFNKEEYLAAVREIEAGGGVQIDDLIAELERRANGSARADRPVPAGVLRRREAVPTRNVRRGIRRGDGPAFTAALKEFGQVKSSRVPFSCWCSPS